MEKLKLALYLYNCSRDQSAMIIATKILLYRMD